MALNDKRLALFFTPGVSLGVWEEAGHLSRESRIYKRLAQRLGGVTFFTYGTGDAKYAGAVSPIGIVPKLRGIPAKLYSLLMPLLRRKQLRKADILKTNQMNGSWAAVLAKLLYGKRLVVRCGFEWEQFRKAQGVKGLRMFGIHAAETLAYRFADAIILTSQEMKRYVRATFGVNEDKILVIPNYIDTEQFRPMPDAEKRPGRLVFTGRLNRQKNLPNLLAAIEGMRDVELLILGDGELRGELEEQARRRKLSVTFAGRVPNAEVPGVLNTGGIFVLPSLFEGNPKALLEAMSCGLPVVATDVEGNREVVRHGVTGYLCEDTSAAAIRRGIETLAKDRDLRAELGRNAREFIEKEYALDVLLEREIGLLESLAGAPGEGRR
jgi:glycosyltransferase involved in cell wall biosynthesis